MSALQLKEHAPVTRAKMITMASYSKVKTENDALRAENIKLRKMNDELALQSGLQSVVPRPVEPATYCTRIIPELRAMADQGATQAEWLAAWDISEETWAEWCDATPDLKAESLRARVRARAVFEAVFRRALMNGDRAFPFAKWVEIMTQRYGVDDPESKGNAGAAVAITVGRCEVCRDVVL